MMRVLTILLLISAWPAQAGKPGFVGNPEVHAFIAQMHDKHGFERKALARLFAQVKPIPAVLKAISPPADPGMRSWAAYRARFVEAKRIRLGLAFWREHEKALGAAHAQFGVPEEIIVAIIGVETIYGRHQGRFGTFAALATLAFGYPPRATLFRKELEELLLLARETEREPLWFTGSYAGALGLPQFLPSSVRRYAVSAAGHARIDLAGHPADAIASVANFLQMHGWERDAPVTAAALVAGEGIAKLLEQGILPNFHAAVARRPR